MGVAVSLIINIGTHRNSYELIVTYKILYWVDWGLYPGSPQYSYSPLSPEKAPKSRRLLTITNYSLLITNSCRLSLCLRQCKGELQTTHLAVFNLDVTAVEDNAILHD